MGVIAQKRLDLLRGMMRSLPRPSLRSLETALGLSKDGAMSEVREMISAELESRHIKETVFGPFMPLFDERDDGLSGVVFDRWIVDRLWSALDARQPDMLVAARQALNAKRADDPTPTVLFDLIDLAAEICRETPEAVMRPTPGPEDAAEVAEFANYLDLHRIIRALLNRMSDFMGRVDAEKAAALRLMFKDACAIDVEGGYRFLECLFANLDDGAQIVKFVATVSDRPNDRFLASSELAGFGERILDGIEQRLNELKAFMGPRGKVCEDLVSCGHRVAQSLAQLQSFEHYIELSREGPWGKRVAAAHKMIAEMVETQLNGAEKLVGEVLPVKAERVYGKIRKETPRIDRPPNEALVARTRQTMVFIKGVRNTAQAGGFASLHTKTVQALETMLDGYFEEMLAIANGPDAFDPEMVLAYFGVVTDLMDGLLGEEKAQVARRRVASSDLNKPRTPQAGAA